MNATLLKFFTSWSTISWLVVLIWFLLYLVFIVWNFLLTPPLPPNKFSFKLICLSWFHYKKIRDSYKISECVWGCVYVCVCVLRKLFGKNKIKYFDIFYILFTKHTFLYLKICLKDIWLNIILHYTQFIFVAIYS